MGHCLLLPRAGAVPSGWAPGSRDPPSHGTLPVGPSEQMTRVCPPGLDTFGDCGVMGLGWGCPDQHLEAGPHRAFTGPGSQDAAGLGRQWWQETGGRAAQGVSREGPTWPYGSGSSHLRGWRAGGRAGGRATRRAAQRQAGGRLGLGASGMGCGRNGAHGDRCSPHDSVPKGCLRGMCWDCGSPGRGVGTERRGDTLTCCPVLSDRWHRPRPHHSGLGPATGSGALL